MKKKGIIAAYKDLLTVTEKTPILSLGEGNTPLLKSENLSKELKINIYFKLEGLNPTGSFKDRGMALAVAKAVESNSKAVICASTGNTSASAAAYAARFDLRCSVLIPEGKIALGKLAQALIYGAKVIEIDSNFDKALNIVKEIAEEHPITLVNSLNPYRIEGQQTAAFEICDYLECSPDYLAIPVGNAGNISAYWKGFKKYYQNNNISKLPKMIGFQAENAAPIVKGEIVSNPDTIATAIRIGNPASWQSALEAARESEGYISSVTDDEIIQAYQILAAEEGIFAEPASAASLAGVIKSKKNNEFKDNETVVCIITGHGLKDPDTAINNISKPVKIISNRDEVIKQIFN